MTFVIAFSTLSLVYREHVKIHDSETQKKIALLFGASILLVLGSVVA